MYIPRSFEETDLNKLHAFMEANNFAILFNTGENGPLATHLPFMIDPQRGPYGTLIAHFAKANDHWKYLNSEEEVLVVFQGPHSYISPKWYRPPTTIPTWNYSAVHAYGKPQVTHNRERLIEMVTDLVHYHEAQMPGLEEDITEARLQSIVGLEIPIARIEGKFKMNQNKTIADQQGVVDVLSQSEDSLQRAVADIMRSNIAAKS